MILAKNLIYKHGLIKILVKMDKRTKGKIVLPKAIGRYDEDFILLFLVEHTLYRFVAEHSIWAFYRPHLLLFLPLPNCPDLKACSCSWRKAIALPYFSARSSSCSNLSLSFNPNMKWLSLRSSRTAPLASLFKSFFSFFLSALSLSGS